MDSNKMPPFYIVGLPEEPVEAAEAQSKFERLSMELWKVYPFIEEVRAVVKTKSPEKGHPWYEVSVEVVTPKERHSFEESGYNIARVFDLLAPKMKRLLSSRQSRVTSTKGDSLRKKSD